MIAKLDLSPELLNIRITENDQPSKKPSPTDDGFYIYVTFSPSRSVRCETKEPPAMRVRIEGYTKKLQTRYN